MKEKKRLVALQMEESLVNALTKEAKSNGLTFSAYVRLLLHKRKSL